jgi:hypothetical protein
MTRLRIINADGTNTAMISKMVSGKTVSKMLGEGVADASAPKDPDASAATMADMPVAIGTPHSTSYIPRNRAFRRGAMLIDTTTGCTRGKAMGWWT